MSVRYSFTSMVVVVVITILLTKSQQIDAMSSGLQDNHHHWPSYSSLSSPRSHTNITDDILGYDNDDDDDDDDDDENDDYGGDDMLRNRRLIYKNKKKYWDIGIVPYELAPDLTKVERSAIMTTMDLYEKYTPIRFVAMDDDVYNDYNIREGFAYFKHKPKGGRCRAYTGFKENPNGQDITCCWGDTCTHEIGHLLGFKHEMVGPKRDKWLNIVDKNIRPGNEGAYSRLDGGLFLDVPYDVYSPMQYHPGNQGAGSGDYTFNFPELEFGWKRHTYYLFQELCLAYKCSDYPECDNMTLKCVNDGFVSVVDDKCACICPRGFDPAFGCARPINKNCGGVIHLTSSKRTATIAYDRRVQKEKNCNWIIRGDPNQDGRLILNFDDFNIEWGNHVCYDQMRMTFTRLGHPGVLMCGPNAKKSVRSVLKDLRIELNSRTVSKSHFKATITWKPDSELCYKSSDNGASYAGLINYSRTYKPCVSWDAALNNKCPSYSVNGGDVRYDLQRNYCRNPDNSFRPWCYVDVNTCEKNYCDVCGDEKPYDVLDKTQCDGIKRNGACAYHAQAIKCAATCQIKENNARVTCPRKDIPVSTLVNPKPSYSVGERAVYECKMVPHNRVERECLSNGQWSAGNTPCTLCPIGWNPYEGKCYKLFTTSLTYQQAKAKCTQHDAQIATPASKAENDFINRLRLGTVIWLGAHVKNKKVYLEDGSLLRWANWIGTVPQLESSRLIMIRDSLWHHLNGHTNFENVICQKATAAYPVCEDFLDNCQYYLNILPTTACSTAPKLKNLCLYSCGWCAKTP